MACFEVFKQDMEVTGFVSYVSVYRSCAGFCALC